MIRVCRVLIKLDNDLDGRFEIVTLQVGSYLRHLPERDCPGQEECCREINAFHVEFLLSRSRFSSAPAEQASATVTKIHATLFIGYKPSDLESTRLAHP